VIYYRLERIAGIEAQRQGGKVLEDDQLTLLASKANLERAFIELEAIRSALEEVARGESTPKLSSSAKGNDTPKASHANASSSANVQTADASTAPAAVEPTINESTQCERTPSVDESTMTVKETVSSAANTYDKVQMLLKALHAYIKYEQQTSRPLPLAVDFFCKSLLGLTSISNFNDSLQQSLRMANLFLDVSCRQPFYFVVAKYIW
jgi:hypothetical protein